MKTIITVLCFNIILFVQAQQQVHISGRIMDGNSGLPLSFVNVGFLNQGVGTVTDGEGNFELSFSSKLLTEETPLRISSVGYKPMELGVESVNSLRKHGSFILMEPDEITLEPVFLSATKKGFERLGSSVYSKSEYGYWSDMDALGGELATRISIGKKGSRLLDLSFNVLENRSDSILIRVKVYKCKRNMPAELVPDENIYHTIRKRKGVESISLKPYNIKVDDDVVIGIELVKAYGEEVYLAVSGSPYGGTAYIKERSFDGWDVRWKFGLAFGVLSSYPEPTQK